MLEHMLAKKFIAVVIYILLCIILISIRDPIAGNNGNSNIQNQSVNANSCLEMK